MVQRSPTDIQKRTFDFSVRVIRLVDQLPRTLAAMEIGRQLLRSGISVGANVQEADAAEEVKALIQESTELTRILFTIIANARKARR